MYGDKSLLIVLACPPTTSGTRTLARIENFKAELNISSVTVANLLNVASYRTNGMSATGITETPWLESREPILRGLEVSELVLLAYGVSEPSGPARTWHREQIAWLHSEITSRELPAIQIGEGPRHPSRWHRLTTKTHPEQDVSKAVVELIQPAALS
jgi:hypothetical protein